MAGIYLHIPFCKQACHYCDFHFSTNLETKREIIAAIAEELVWQSSYTGTETIKTIYFGGGTPSLLSEEDINTLLDAIRKNYRLEKHPEITLEANPDDLSASRLEMLRATGINRLSIGIQSFDDQILRFLNRAHDAVAAQACVMDAREAGFDNISVDLIYAIPGQNEGAWRANIQQALALAPEHISSYSLTIEEKTAFGKWSAAGKLKPVEDEAAAAQLEMLVDLLEHSGYEQYEVSNFARAGFQSRHNSSYWKQEPYIGVGPSAHSYNGVSRQYNVPNNHAYLQAIRQQRIPFTREVLTLEDKINDFLLTTLRTAWGTSLRELRTQFGYDLLAVHKDYLENLIAQKLAYLDRDTLILTRRGKLLADKIASDLFLLK